MRRRRGTLAVVVLVAAVAAAVTACQPATLPIGARASGDGVEVFAASCSGAPVDIQLFETEDPLPTTTRSRGSTPGPGSLVPGSTTPGTAWSSGAVVWHQRIPADQRSIVVPITLDPSRGYTIMAEGGTDDPSFERYTFVPADLSPDTITPYGAWNRAIPPEAFGEAADSACDAAAGGPLPWIFAAAMVVAFLVLAGFGLSVGLLIRSAMRPRRPPPAPWR